MRSLYWYSLLPVVIVFGGLVFLTIPYVALAVLVIAVVVVPYRLVRATSRRWQVRRSPSTERTTTAPSPGRERPAVNEAGEGGLDEGERNRLLRELKRLRLAQSDMAQAATADEALKREREESALGRALEAACVVIYTRPFTSNKLGRLGDEWAPTDPEERALHDELCKKRDQVYAHSDETLMHDVVDIGASIGKDHPVYAERWHPVNRDSLPAFIKMAWGQEKRFYDAAVEVERQLGGKQLGLDA